MGTTWDHVGIVSTGNHGTTILFPWGQVADSDVFNDFRIWDIAIRRLCNVTDNERESIEIETSIKGWMMNKINKLFSFFDCDVVSEIYTKAGLCQFKLPLLSLNPYIDLPNGVQLSPYLFPLQSVGDLFRQKTSKYGGKSLVRRQGYRYRSSKAL